MLVRFVTTVADRDAAYDIRRRVFQDEQGVPADEEFDDEDESAIHAVAVDDGAVVGTGRLVLLPGYAKIGRMAVLRTARQIGVGRAILETLLAEATRRGAPRAVLHAQVQALGFYERSGFTAIGPVFDEAGIPHRRMERML